MRKISITFLAISLFVVPALSSSGEEGYYSKSYAYLSYVKGDVYVQRAQDLGYEEGTVNLPVVAGDMLGTNEGRTEIHLGSGNYLRTGFNTQVEIADLPTRVEDIIKLHLLTGSMYLRINLLEREKSFEVHTPDASYYILETGLYRFNVKEGNRTEVFVYEGAVEAAGEEGSILVEREQRFAAKEGIFISKPVFFTLSLSDDFSEWNDYRDALLQKKATSSYLPSELNEFENVLADNGRWVNEEPYGNVWVPYVSYDEWRPFNYGRWVWYPVIGWTWISNDSWGWCTYRYGRWHWRNRLGWYWIPTNVWGPAWVYWNWGYDYIGWCPISYYGYPVVVINNIFYGRYYSRDYPYRSRALTIIRKGQMQARHISKHSLKKNELKQVKKISLSTKKLGIDPVVKRVSKGSEAARVLLRPESRKIGKKYVSGKRILNPSRLKPTELKKPSKKISSPSIKKYPTNRTVPSKRMIGESRSRLEKNIKSRTSTITPRKPSSSKTKNISPRPTIKTYKRSSSSSTLRPSPKKNLPVPAYRSKTLTPRTEKGKTTPKIYKSRISTSTNSSKVRSSSSTRYVSSPKSSSSTQRYLTRKYKPSSSSIRTPSRSSSRSSSSSRYSSPSRSSSSRSTSSRYSSPSRSSSSSRSRSSVSRSSSSSSSRSSSSRSSSSSSRSSSSSSKGKVTKKK